MSIDQIKFDPSLESEMRIEGTREEAGLRVHDVKVPDGYEGVRYSWQRKAVRKLLGSFEDYLRKNPDLTYDSEDNRARQYLDAIPAVAAWKSLMPSAMALYPLQRPEEDIMPNGARMDAVTRELFRHGLDAVGIRSRAKVMQQLMLQKTYEANGETIEWLSLACGAAVPVLDAIGAIKQENLSADFKLSLVDMSREAIDFATMLATDQGLTEDEDFVTVRKNLISGLIDRDTLVDEFGEDSKDMIDMLGIFEYFDKERAVNLLRNAFRMVKPGGTMIIGNMLVSHPNMRINEAAVGWPGIKPRSLEEISAIIQAADIESTDCDVYIPEDGVYAVVEIRKPEEAQILAHPTANMGAAALSLAKK